ncbi:DUF262 domain-containing protein [Dactylosporangium sp. CA-233914]|uniref:DUF262 domain-containing protein n=1 Tax=Dactylosporangium sp. CA-233914 TaxID=3239934 RepID=UPI003D8AE6EC
MRPRIELRTLGDLVHEVRRGAVRIPQFQRGFKWDADDVVKLFDSVLRGYPIGNLLFWRRPAPAQTLHLGPLTIDAPQSDSAWWVVDGQQRITSLVGALSAADTATDLRFRVHLDLDSGEFSTAGIRQQPPGTWVPVSFLLHDRTLLSWMKANQTWLSEAQLDLADRAGLAIRDYEIPVYMVVSDEERSLLDIYTRINTAGRQLTKAEVFQALHTLADGDAPLTLEAIGRGPAELGFGALDDQLVMRCLDAYQGGDVVRSGFTGAFESDQDREETFGAIAAILRDVIAFLRDTAEIPHVKLLPQPGVVPLLVRFVKLHGAPEGRAATLLRRWIWRSAVAGARVRGHTRTVEKPDPVAAASALLQQVPPDVRFVADLNKVHLGQTTSKINILGLWSAGPRDPSNGSPVDIARLLDHSSPLRPIFDDSDLPLTGTIANRIIAAPGPALRQALATASLEVAESHLVDEEAQHLLARGATSDFLARRAEATAVGLQRHVDRMAEWGARDGRSIADLLRTG